MKFELKQYDMSADKLINLVFCILSLFCLYIALKNGDIQAMATFNVIAFVTASLFFQERQE